MPRRSTPCVVASSAGHWPTSSWSEEARLPRQHRPAAMEATTVRDRRPDRPGARRRLHAPGDGHPRVFAHRGALARASTRRCRFTAGQSYLRRQAVRADVARRPAEHRSARGPTRSSRRSSPSSACATSARASNRPSAASRTRSKLCRPSGTFGTPSRGRRASNDAARPGRRPDAAPTPCPLRFWGKRVRYARLGDRTGMLMKHREAILEMQYVGAATPTAGKIALADLGLHPLPRSARPPPNGSATELNRVLRRPSTSARPAASSTAASTTSSTTMTPRRPRPPWRRSGRSADSRPGVRFTDGLWASPSSRRRPPGARDQLIRSIDPARR